MSEEITNETSGEMKIEDRVERGFYKAFNQ